MREMDARAEFRKHGRQIVGAVGAEGAGAEGEPAGRGGDGGEQRPHVRGRRHHARQAEDREGGIVGVDGEPHAFLLRHFRDLADEGDEVGAQVLDADVAIAPQRLAEARAVVGEIARGQPVDQRAFEFGALVRAQRFEPGAGLRPALRRIVFLRALAFENEQVVGREVERVEAQREAAAGRRPHQVGAGPVGDRHEIVAEHLDAGARGVAQGLFVIVELRAPAAAAGLDLLADADALDDAP